MSDDDKKEGGKKPDKRTNPSVVAFPHSRVSPQPVDKTYKDLGVGNMGDKYGLPKEQLSGHWCSRCEGIWFGYLLETECPKCGNRHG